MKIANGKSSLIFYEGFKSKFPQLQKSWNSRRFAFEKFVSRVLIPYSSFLAFLIVTLPEPTTLVTQTLMIVIFSRW